PARGMEAPGPGRAGVRPGVLRWVLLMRICPGVTFPSSPLMTGGGRGYGGPAVRYDAWPGLFACDSHASPKVGAPGGLPPRSAPAITVAARSPVMVHPSRAVRSRHRDRAARNGPGPRPPRTGIPRAPRPRDGARAPPAWQRLLGPVGLHLPGPR